MRKQPHYPGSNPGIPAYTSLKRAFICSFLFFRKEINNMEFEMTELTEEELSNGKGEDEEDE